MGTSKIIPRILGGIGNQLFCYAAARRMALVNNAELVIDDVSGFVRDHDYQRQYQLDHFSIPFRKARAVERLEPFSRVRRYLKRVSNRRRPFEERTYIQQEIIDFDSRLLHVRPHGTVYLEGYWQSEDYFKDVEDIIRLDLSIKPPEDPVNAAMVTNIGESCAVAVHVRFFDDPEVVVGINNAPNDYYAMAVTYMETFAPEAHYFVFSDKPEVARARIPLADDRITCVSHNQGDINAYADLWLMSQCQHFIIANSTFSWWGAWLGESKASIVLSPSMKLSHSTITSWDFLGQIPDRWLKL